jgi:hypothetical protein
VSVNGEGDGAGAGGEGGKFFGMFRNKSKSTAPRDPSVNQALFREFSFVASDAFPE